MAKIRNELVELHKLDKDKFVLRDKTIVSPTHLELAKEEYEAMLASGQAGILLEKYQPIMDPETQAFTFKLRSNHERSIYRKMQRENKKNKT